MGMGMAMQDRIVAVAETMLSRRCGAWIRTREGCSSQNTLPLVTPSNNNTATPATTTVSDDITSPARPTVRSVTTVLSATRAPAERIDEVVFRDVFLGGDVCLSTRDVATRVLLVTGACSDEQLETVFGVHGRVLVTRCFSPTHGTCVALEFNNKQTAIQARSVATPCYDVMCGCRVVSCHVMSCHVT